jgi:hypothetical protein
LRQEIEKARRQQALRRDIQQLQGAIAGTPGNITGIVRRGGRVQTGSRRPLR